MDIAEIRNKAKAEQQKGAQKEMPPAVEQTPAAEVDQVDAPGSESAEQLHAAAGPVEEHLAQDAQETASSSAALEKLFSNDSSFELATVEDYEDALLLQDAENRLDFRQYLSFQLGQEEYALDITQISEIIKVREFTDIPRVPAFILGIISLRGVVVPVFDLKKRFHLGVAELTSASRIIVCQLGEVTAGLLVDKINQVISINDSSLEPPPAVLSGLDRELVDGVGRYEGRMIILLKLQSVLDVELI